MRTLLVLGVLLSACGEMAVPIDAGRDGSAAHDASRIDATAPDGAIDDEQPIDVQLPHPGRDARASDVSTDMPAVDCMAPASGAASCSGALPCQIDRLFSLADCADGSEFHFYGTALWPAIVRADDYCAASVTVIAIATCGPTSGTGCALHARAIRDWIETNYPSRGIRFIAMDRPSTTPTQSDCQAWGTQHFPPSTAVVTTVAMDPSGGSLALGTDPDGLVLVADSHGTLYFQQSFADPSTDALDGVIRSILTAQGR